jgi:hypothetical protein
VSNKLLERALNRTSIKRIILESITVMCLFQGGRFVGQQDIQPTTSFVWPVAVMVTFLVTAFVILNYTHKLAQEEDLYRSQLEESRENRQKNTVLVFGEDGEAFEATIIDGNENQANQRPDM